VIGTQASTLATTALALVIVKYRLRGSAALPTNETEALPRRGADFPFNPSTFLTLQLPFPGSTKQPQLNAFPFPPSVGNRSLRA
jgi:hypothetical protein